jgi:hypothetical protein
MIQQLVKESFQLWPPGALLTDDDGGGRRTTRDRVRETNESISIRHNMAVNLWDATIETKKPLVGPNREIYTGINSQ